MPKTPVLGRIWTNNGPKCAAWCGGVEHRGPGNPRRLHGEGAVQDRPSFRHRPSSGPSTEFGRTVLRCPTSISSAPVPRTACAPRIRSNFCQFRSTSSEIGPARAEIGRSRRTLVEITTSKRSKPKPIWLNSPRGWPISRAHCPTTPKSSESESNSGQLI